MSPPDGAEAIRRIIDMGEEVTPERQGPLEHDLRGRPKMN